MANLSSIYNSGSLYEQLISQVIAVESQPRLKLRAEQTEQGVYKGVLSDFSSKVSALDALLNKLRDPLRTPFEARAATVSEGAGFTATASDTAAASQHEIRVDRLARADTRVSRRFDGGGSSLRSFFDANGVQTFSVDVASPTADDPTRHVPVAVTVLPVGSTDGEILAEIRQAMSDAMSARVSAGDINAGDAALPSVINETSGTARLSLRSGGTGYSQRLQFTDSEAGLLDLLHLNRAAPATAPATETVTTPATRASYTGQAASFPLVVDGSNEEIELDVSGTRQKFKLDRQVYFNADELAAGMAAQIDAEFGAGVVAVDVVDGALRLRTTDTGSGASLQIVGGDDPTAFGLEIMAAPVTGTDETTTTATIPGDEAGGWMHDVGTSETTSALNARFQVDGLTLYRSSNTVDDALEGVTLTLSKVTEEAGALSVGSDVKGMRSEVEAFIKAYNGLGSFLSSKSKVDADAGTRGVLSGDSTVSALRYGMRNDLSRRVPGAGSLRGLEDLGITTARDGTLTLSDPAKLDAALEASPESVGALFSGDDGFAARLGARFEGILGASGTIAQRKKGADARIDRLDAQIKRWDARLERREALLRDQFARLEAFSTQAISQQNSLASMFYY